MSSRTKSYFAKISTLIIIKTMLIEILILYFATLSRNKAGIKFFKLKI